MPARHSPGFGDSHRGSTYACCSGPLSVSRRTVVSVYPWMAVLPLCRSLIAYHYRHTAAMLTARVSGGTGRHVWTISYNMQQLVLSFFCVTLMLHCIAAVAAGRLHPIRLELGVCYYSFGFVLIVYAAVVTLIVRARPGVLADVSSLQQSACGASDRCYAAINAAILVAACCWPPVLIIFLLGPVPALIVLACLAVAGVTSAALLWCWACLAAGRAASGEPRQQFVSMAQGANLRSQVINRPQGGCCTSRVPFYLL